VPDPKAPPAPDLGERRFVAEAPDQLWLADLTYVPTLEGYLFLAVVMDMCSREIVGWSMRDDLKAELVVDALAMRSRAGGRRSGSSTTPTAARSPRSTRRRNGLLLT
jgi:putative transposase